MEAEASSFETSEMLASFLASTPLISESWKLCDIANTTARGSFVVDRIAGVTCLAFSGVQTDGGISDPCLTNLVPLDCAGTNGMFSVLQRHVNEGEEEHVMVHSGLLHLFLTLCSSPSFHNQMLAIMTNSKSVIITGHSIGGATASLTALWLLCYLRSIYSHISVLCITFGSPLLGNESLSRAILRERWGGSFCHVVSKHDIVPRLLLAPLAHSLTPQLHSLLQFWHFSMSSSSSEFPNLFIQTVPVEVKINLFYFVRSHLEVSAMSPFRPFGNYLFCSGEGAICVDNSAAIVSMLHAMFMKGSPNFSIEDHLKYGDYVGKVSLQFLSKRSFMEGEEIPVSSYEAGLALALQSSGIAAQDSVARPAAECLRTARRMMGRSPNLNCANLAIGLANITPYRAEIEWYMTSCDDQMGYYDSFKRRGASKRDSKINMNRHKLAVFWNNVIYMLDNNQLPYDFHKRAKWVNASQFYKLLVEPLDIAEYYRTGMHRSKGHYMTKGRDRRYEIFDRWWRERRVSEEENNNRSKFAGLTQDSCFWARVEEAREWLENARSEGDMGKLALLWQNMDKFAMYAMKLVENKEVSRDVVAKNSSYTLLVEEWRELKSQRMYFHLQPSPFMDGEVVP